MVKEVLMKEEGNGRDWRRVRQPLVTDRVCGMNYLEVLFLGTEQQRLAAAGDVGHRGHDQERGVVGENVVEEPEPLITSQNLREQGLQQRPDVKLGQTQCVSATRRHGSIAFNAQSRYL